MAGVQSSCLQTELASVILPIGILACYSRFPAFLGTFARCASASIRTRKLGRLKKTVGTGNGLDHKMKDGVVIITSNTY